MILSKPLRHNSTKFESAIFPRQLLLKEIQCRDITVEICEIKNNYDDDINFESLPTELQVQETVFKEQKPSNAGKIGKTHKNCN